MTAACIFIIFGILDCDLIPDNVDDNVYKILVQYYDGLEPIHLQKDVTIKVTIL